MTTSSTPGKPAPAGTPPRGIVLSVVMPACDEEAAIETVVREHLEAIAALPAEVCDWEVVVVDDGSADGTPQILARLAAAEPRLHVLRHATNLGLVRAFDAAHRAARGTHVFSTGADGQWPAGNLPRMMQRLLETGADLVVGVRRQRFAVYTPWRRLVSRGYRLLPRLLFSVDVQDPGSVKLGRREVFQQEMVSRGPFVEAERILRCVRQGRRVEFVPIEFLPRGGGKARGARVAYVAASLLDCLRCFWVYRLRAGRATPPPAAV